MRGCFFVAVGAFQFGLLLFKVGGVGDVKLWDWSTVLIPLWFSLCLGLLFLVPEIAESIKNGRRLRSSLSVEEGPVEAFFRRRRARRHKRDMERWGVSK